MVKRGLLFVGIFILLPIFPVSARETVILQDDEFRVDLVRVDPSPITPGETVDVWFEVFNLGESQLDDVSLRLSASFPFSAETSEITVPSLGVDDNVMVQTTLSVNSNAPPGSYDVGLSYYSQKAGLYLSETFELDVVTTGKSITPVQYQTSPEELSPGQSGTITVSFENTADSDLRDVVVSLDLSDAALPLASADSTPQQVIKDLAIGEHASVAFTFYVLPDATADIYKIPLTITYFDDLGELVTVESVVSIVVNADLSFQINVEDTDIYGTGQRGTVTVSISNIAPVDARFVNIELVPSEYFEVLSASSVYIGDLESDDFDTVEYDLYVNSATEDGSVPFDLIVTYKDVYNNEYEIDKTLSIQTYSYWEQVALGLKSTRGIVTLAIILVVIIAIAVGYATWRGRKRKS